MNIYLPAEKPIQKKINTLKTTLSAEMHSKNNILPFIKKKHDIEENESDHISDDSDCCNHQIVQTSK